MAGMQRCENLLDTTNQTGVELANSSQVPTLPSISIFFSPPESVVASAMFVLNRVSSAPVKFDAKYHDALKRKRDVNLYIADGRVVFQFNYNNTVIEAVKKYIKGRTWDKTVGVKGSWTCPIECLPDAVALYEHMGRSADSAIKERAAKVRSAGGSSRINFEVRVAQFDGSSTKTNPSIGSLIVTFAYDPALVAAIKQLSPAQRSYDKKSKSWTLDLLALPEVLEHLKPLGYDVSEMQSLQNLSVSCERVGELLFPASGLSEDEDGRRLNELLLELNKLLKQVQDVPVLDGPARLDSSDCGAAKRRKLTHLDTDDFLIGGWADSVMSAFRGLSSRIPAMPADCDCGHPEKLIGGRHCCRYFGTFSCACGHRWTSAYCWKGERQACRICELESLPIKKEQLDGRPGSGTGGGHDSSRCTKCLRLGYDCSNAGMFAGLF
eukprot:TRINITY_DN19959_c1_g1_i1.p1 TRINITY_DN19959_c1_g1~~TRINITY_DN19959_c1_g1_i1.p1  ORF type:complete len:453 (-),score=61.77 TRINITY_DN19959_c1_g1_i1:358-1668(-)